MPKFIGREYELMRLQELQTKKTASLIVVKGRRRIGKSRLLDEFGKSFDHYYKFSGLPPEPGVTNQKQLDEFAIQMSREFRIAQAKYTDWGDIFWALSERVQRGKLLILFDEISWMGSEDPAFLGKIKNLWDLHLKKNDRLIFAICGSASSWIEKNILLSTGFVGRISMTLTLNELSLAECNSFFSNHASPYEKLKILSVTGGVPKYLEEILPQYSAEENITRLCFRKGGFLVDEFHRIFSDIFLRNSEYYKNILMILINGSKGVLEICDALDVMYHGRISEYLDELELAGFVRSDYLWNLQTGTDTRLKKYRLSDNYIRFYLKYIEKNYSQIQRDAFEVKLSSSLPQWATMMGFQFENLVLMNRRLLQETLRIRPEEIASENPYFQKETKQHKQCQIDYLVQTRHHTLYVCEIKFSKNPIGVEVIAEVQEKIRRLKYPKGFSTRPVLIHVNGVTEDVIDECYFSDIVDFSAFLDSDSKKRT